MRDYVIITDATADFSPKMLDELEITQIPMEFVVGEDTFLHYADARNLGFKEFYDRLRAGKTSTTMQINVSTFIEYFEKAFDQEKDVLYIGFSSGLSGSFNSAKIAIEELRERRPDGKVEAVDSLSASGGEAFLTYYAALEKRKGRTLDETAEWTRENRLRVNHWFTVDDLNHLKRGGRVSPAMAFAGTLLGIKPLLNFDNDGKIVSVGKSKGRRKAIEDLVSRMESMCVNPEEQVIFISHGDCEDDAQLLESIIREKFNVKDVVTGYVGPIIGSHSGPGTLALFFFADHR